MKTLQTIGLLLLLSHIITSTAQANPVCGAGLSARNEAKNDLKEELLVDYGNSYSTVAMLLESGMRDYDRICRIRSTLVNVGILEELKLDYYPSFSTIYLLYKNNKKAHGELEDDTGCSFRC